MRQPHTTAGESQVKESPSRVEHQDGSGRSDGPVVMNAKGISYIYNFLFLPQGSRTLLKATADFLGTECKIIVLKKVLLAFI